MKKKGKILVLGSGVYCIGSSVEFDWSSATVLKTLRDFGYETVMINYNPETVSTDFQNSDKLYFEELSLEKVLDIYEKEKPDGIILSTGGQIANNIALKLKDNDLKVLGTCPSFIHTAEDRANFSSLCDELNIDQPKWKSFSTKKEAIDFSENVGYPVLVRPSFVLSGAAMAVAHTEVELLLFLEKASKISKDAPVVISKFEENAKEIEIDAVGSDGEMIIYAIAEHIENAGVHSGDATICIPPQKIYLETVRRAKKIAKKLCKKLNITGPFNIQFLAKNNDLKVIELNLRASRSVPFVSKATGFNFIEIATRCMIGDTPSKKERMGFKTLDLDFVCTKASQFSFSRLSGADPVLGVEMASTGEVGCFGKDLEESYLKSLLSVGFKIPEKRIFLSAGKTEDKTHLIEATKTFQKLGIKICATKGTGEFLQKSGVENVEIMKKASEEGKNIVDFLKEKYIDLVINIPRSFSNEENTDGYKIRRQAIDSNISLLTNPNLAKLLATSMEKYKMDDLEIKSYDEYFHNV